MAAKNGAFRVPVLYLHPAFQAFHAFQDVQFIGILSGIEPTVCSNPLFRTIRLACRPAFGEPTGSLMAGHSHVECPERAKRVEGPCLPSLSIASSSYALRLPRSLHRSVVVRRLDERRRGTRRHAQRWTRRDLHEGPPPGNAGFSPRRTQPWRQRFRGSGKSSIGVRQKKEALVAGDSAALKRFAISHASPRSAGLKLARNTCQKPEANDGNDDWNFHE